jgi:hypothetical protein
MRFAKASLMSLAVAAVATVVVAPAAQAKRRVYATVQAHSLEFPANVPVPYGQSTVYRVKLGSTLNLTAPAYIDVPATAGSPRQVWRFAFWDVGATPSLPTAGHGTVEPSVTVNFKASSTGTFAATAWYVLNSSMCRQDEVCPTTVTAAVFDESQDIPVAGLNPIATVNPASAWTAGTQTVSTTGVSPTIYTQKCVGGVFQYPTRPYGWCTSAQVFSTWLGSGTSRTADKVPAGDGGYVIAVTKYAPRIPSATSIGSEE